MKNYSYFVLILLLPNVVFAQYALSGKVTDGRNGIPLQGAVIAFTAANLSTKSTADGSFNLNVPDIDGKLTVSRTGYTAQNVAYHFVVNKPIQIVLHEKMTDIEEVVLSTGYQKIPKERATGSFSVVNQKTLDQQVSPFILDKLVGSANGVTLSSGTGSGDTHLMVRGLSTIRGPKSPLIVVDNFPYEGDLKTINPNTIESVTILKDAAAASIWGARAANGVIVLTTKTAKFREAVSVELNTSLSVSGKPDLGYIPFMSSSDFIGVEEELFNRGFYDEDLTSYQHPVVSPVVHLLDQQRQGILSSEELQRQLAILKNVDVRDQYRRHMYIPAESRQYSLNLSAGSEKLAWNSFLGYDDNSGNLNEIYRRLNVRVQNNWTPLKNLSLTNSVGLTQTNTKSGRNAYGSVRVKNNGLPYLRFADDQGNALPVYATYNQEYKESLGEGKLLDWNYYPLTNWQHEKASSKNTELILNTAAHYQITPDLNVDLRYQYQSSTSRSEKLYDEESYYARNYVNLFSVIDETGSIQHVVPIGGILDTGHHFGISSNARAQVNYSKKWEQHEVNALAGGEVRDLSTHYSRDRYYGYQPSTLNFSTLDYNTYYPTLMESWSAIDSGKSLRKTTTRFVSLYANSAYTYNGKYTLSASIRRDASNLFGLKTNDQWNPFWSAGASWNVSKEKFYPLSFIPNLKLRGSYGFNGNIDPAMVAATTISYLGTSPFTQTQMATFSNYFNPHLKWETIKMVNVGLDFTTKNQIISGSVEWYHKKGDELFGYTPMDYTTGISSMLWNVAAMKGSGWDLALNTVNMNRAFKWNTTFNLSTNRDEVTRYYLSTTYGSEFVIPSVPISGVEGKPVYSIFAYQWAGLDPETGDPVGYLNGEESKDYAAITGTGTDVKDLEYFGSAVPTIFGNMSHTFGFKNWNFDVGLSYKLGYYFRRPSIDYNRLFTEWAGHSDYTLRWQKPGDEAYTNVPSAVFETNSARDEFYAGSSVLIEKGDHIRWQFINLSYTIPESITQKKIFKNAKIYFNLNNLGILWKSTSSKIDPDYNLGNFNLLPPLTMTLGFRTQF